MKGELAPGLCITIWAGRARRAIDDMIEGYTTSDLPEENDKDEIRVAGNVAREMIRMAEDAENENVASICRGRAVIEIQMITTMMTRLDRMRPVDPKFVRDGRQV